MADTVLVAGISTLGVKFGYAVETEAGTKPTAFTQLHRISSIGEIASTRETIDADALEDYDTPQIEGKTTNSTTFDVVVNLTNETQAEWEALIAAYEALDGGKAMWVETWFPELDDAIFVKIAPPTILPAPAVDKNGLFTATMTLVVKKYVGYDTAIEPSKN